MNVKKYILSISLVFILGFGLVSPVFTQEVEKGVSAKMSAIIGLFQFVSDDDIHLKDLVNDYFFGADANADFITGDILGVVGKVNPRRFTLSKHTIYNRLLARMLDLIIEQGSIGGDLDAMITMCESLLFENRDPIIYPKVVQVYNIAQSDSPRFVKYVLFTLQKLAYSTDYKYNTGSVVTQSIPYVTERINAEVVRNPDVTSLSMNIYSATLSLSAIRVMKDLLTAIVSSSLG